MTSNKGKTMKITSLTGTIAKTNEKAENSQLIQFREQQEFACMVTRSIKLIGVDFPSFL